MFDHPAVCRALIGDLGRAGRMPELAGAIRNVFHAPVEQRLEEGEADGSLRRLSNRSGAASAVFGAVTIAGLEILVMATGPGHQRSRLRPRLATARPGQPQHHRDKQRSRDAVEDEMVTGADHVRGGGERIEPGQVPPP